jgi:hypothetical protein
MQPPREVKGSDDPRGSVLVQTTTSCCDSCSAASSRQPPGDVCVCAVSPPSAPILPRRMQPKLRLFACAPANAADFVPLVSRLDSRLSFSGCTFLGCNKANIKTSIKFREDFLQVNLNLEEYRQQRGIKNTHGLWCCELKFDYFFLEL